MSVICTRRSHQSFWSLRRRQEEEGAGRGRVCLLLPLLRTRLEHNETKWCEIIAFRGLRE